MKIQVVMIFGNGRPVLVVFASIGMRHPCVYSLLIVSTALKSTVSLKNPGVLSNQNVETLSCCTNNLAKMPRILLFLQF